MPKPGKDLEDDLAVPEPPEVDEELEVAEAVAKVEEGPDDDAFEPDPSVMEGGDSIEAVNRYRMPDTRNREMFAIADQLMGASKIKAMCEDGKSRMARIPGKMKRRMWIKPGDLMIVKPWDFQDDKADVKYRYLRTQAVNLSRRKKLPELLDGAF
ncbi:MAG TPA: translation initiation factor eIF-1A [Candidatus Thermoplasmatota archaeon]|nr:translation initiation factor eIF-1A [Candidatus Thermoplasmatota archaeon]